MYVCMCIYIYIYIHTCIRAAGAHDSFLPRTVNPRSILRALDELRSQTSRSPQPPTPNYEHPKPYTLNPKPPKNIRALVS